MHAVKLSLTFEPSVAHYLQTITKGERSKKVNKILKEYIMKEMAEGFEQPAEGFEEWEQLGFETWK